MKLINKLFFILINYFLFFQILYSFNILKSVEEIDNSLEFTFTNLPYYEIYREKDSDIINIIFKNTFAIANYQNINQDKNNIIIKINYKKNLPDNPNINLRKDGDYYILNIKLPKLLKYPILKDNKINNVKRNAKKEINNLDQKESDSPLSKDFLVNNIYKKESKENIPKLEINNIYNKIKNNKFIIVLDAGHGGRDPGAISVFKNKLEKDYTLLYVKEIYRRLSKNINYEIYLTRDRDKFISLKDRIKFTKSKKANLFISIHVDSAKNKKASGASIYTISDKGQNRKRKHYNINESKINNKNKRIKDTLLEIGQRNDMNNSILFTKILIKNLGGKKIPVKKYPHKFAGFAVLNAPNTAAILLELGYLSNKKDAKNLLKKSYIENIVNAVDNAIFEYYNQR